MRGKNLLLKWLSVIWLAMLVQNATAQAIFCDDFNTEIVNWYGYNAKVSFNMDTTSSNGTGYLKALDRSGASLVYNNTNYIGSALPCGGRICWRFKVIEDGLQGNSTPVTPSLTIFTGPVENPTLVATFKATSVTVNETSPWVNVCAPIRKSVNGAMPFGWTMGNNGTVADWDQLSTSFTGIGFSTEVSDNAFEIFGFDDLCINPSPCCNPNATSDFTINSECVNDVWTVTAYAAAPVSPNNWWGLMETSQAGNTDDNVTLNNGNPVQLITGGFTATFTGLDINKSYYIKHIISDPYCYNDKETRIAFERPKIGYLFGVQGANIFQIINTLCYNDPVKVIAIGYPFSQSYSISLWRRPINSPLATPYTFLANTGTINGNMPGYLNLTTIFGALPTPVYFEPNFEYSFRATVDPEGDCYLDTELENTVTITCCNNFLRPDFCLDAIAGNEPDKYTLRVGNYVTFSQVGAVNEWYVLSSPNPSGGPYTHVTTVTSSISTFDLYTQAEYGLYYTVVHKLITACGQRCAMNVQYQTGRPTTGNDCSVTSIDCNWIDSIWRPCDVPRGLLGNCIQNVLLWNPVQWAAGYTVEISYNDPACCRSSYSPTARRYNVTGSSLPLWSIASPKYDCFRWRVMTKCTNGTVSNWSAWQCYDCRRIEEYDTILLRNVVLEIGAGKQALDPVVSPNPSNGDMTLSLQAPGDLIVSVDVINAQGSRIKTIARNTYKGGLFNTKLSLGAAAKGVYIVVFNTNYGTFRKKVIVQ